MHRILKRSLVAVFTSLMVVGTSLAGASPAQAYDNSLHWDVGRIDTGNCFAVGSVAWGYGNGDGYCYLGNTHFKDDSGGIAFKTEVLSGSVGNWTRLAKITFHPYGEILKVCDTENDGDSIHVKLRYRVGGQWISLPLVSPPGTSKDIECTRKNYSLPEGAEVRLTMWDDTSMTDRMASFWNIRA